MKRLINKLLGRKYCTYRFEGNVFGEQSCHASITTPIENKSKINPDKYFSDSVTIWNSKPIDTYYSVSIPEKSHMDGKHIYIPTPKN